MSNDTGYTRIVFNRSDLFEVCRLGFMAQSVGQLWCEGWMRTERLDQLDVPFRKA